MAKYEPPSDFRSERADGADKAKMTRLAIRQNTCPWCATVYKTHAVSQKCELWHKVLFRQQRADLAEAIKKATRQGDHAQADRLTRQRNKIPADL